MVRKPVCLSVNDTVGTALEQGRQFGRSFFPVMDWDTLVGTVSDLDIFNSLYQILGVAERYSGLTVKLDRPDREMVREIVETVFAAGGKLHCLFTLKDPETEKRRLLLRLDKEGLDRVNEALKERGFKILELVRRNG
jgi:acetoin utilization protein AcuB